MKTLLILTGPQGSGNHLFAKIFSLHSSVGGWKALLENYWIGHDQEPFNRFWLDPSLMRPELFSQYEYWVTSISVPYIQDGKIEVPDFAGFVSAAVRADFDVRIAVIGRDATVLRCQQQRVRGMQTLDSALEEIKKLSVSHNLFFISQELLFLYKEMYLQTLSRILSFPIELNHPTLPEILKEDANCKYIRPVSQHWLDVEVKKASSPRQRGRL